MTAPLSELYQGEVLGEALFSRMLADVDDAARRHLVATMLQLETETKARLRPVLVERGLPVEEDDEWRAAGRRVGESLAATGWSEKISRLVAGVGETYLPRYEEIAAAASGAEADATAFMVEHEKALLAALRHAGDDDLAGALSRIEGHLAHPLPRPATDPVA